MYEPMESQKSNGASNRGFAFVEFETHMDASTVKVGEIFSRCFWTSAFRKTFSIDPWPCSAATTKMWTGLIPRTRRMMPSCQLWKTSMSKVPCGECDSTRRRSLAPVELGITILRLVGESNWRGNQGAIRAVWKCWKGQENQQLLVCPFCWERFGAERQEF